MSWLGIREIVFLFFSFRSQKKKLESIPVVFFYANLALL